MASDVLGIPRVFEINAVFEKIGEEASSG